MNPHQKNKIDINSLSADEQRLFRLYGKLPNKRDVAQRKLEERKYFDSGDYALSKAGKASSIGVTTIGTEHPQAENIPHLSASSPPNSASSPSGGVPGLPHHQQDGSHFLPGAGGHRGSIQGMHGSVQNKSPVKESSYLARTASVDEQESASAGAGSQRQQQHNTIEEQKQEDGAATATATNTTSQDSVFQEVSISPAVMQQGGLPIRR